MNEPAKNTEVKASLTVEGLDDLFIQPLRNDHGRDQGALLNFEQSADRGGQQPCADFDHPDHWTLQTAAETLNVSVATVRRRLAKKELRGYKIDGTNGPEWRVIPPDHDGAQTVCNEQGRPEHPAANPEQPVISALLYRLSDVEAELAKAQKELQSANWRNGYLESQLEERSREIKLLTNEQHKSGWLTKLSCWFARRI